MVLLFIIQKHQHQHQSILQVNNLMKKSIFALSLGTLGLGMSEFSMMGILPDIANNLKISIPQAGHFISAYAIGVAIGAPILILFTRNIPLKKILLLLVGIYLIGNLGFALSSDYWTCLIARFISGLPHGAYFGVASIVAREIAPKGKEASAIAGMVSGMTFANLVGVPLGTFISHQLSWHITFIIVALLAIAIFFFIIKWVPSLPPLPNAGFKGQFRFLKKQAPWLIMIATIMGNGGIFAWYSYVNPIMTNCSGFSESAMTGVMMFAGLGMVLGNLVSGGLSDKFSPAKIGTYTQGFVIILLLSIFLFAHLQWISLALMFLTTAALFALSAPQQLLLLENSKGGEMLGGACIQVAFNIGNAVGAYFGGIPIARNLSENYAALPGVGLAFIGFLSFFYFYKSSIQKANRPSPNLTIPE